MKTDEPLDRDVAISARPDGVPNFFKQPVEFHRKRASLMFVLDGNSPLKDMFDEKYNVKFQRNLLIFQSIEITALKPGD